MSSLKQCDAAGFIGYASKDLKALLHIQETSRIWKLQERPHHDHLTDIGLEVFGLSLVHRMKPKRIMVQKNMKSLEVPSSPLSGMLHAGHGV